MQGIYVLHVFCAGTYLSLAAYVLARDPRARLNWITASVNVCFALWSVALAVAHYPGCSKEVAALAYNLGSFAWGSVASVSCLFIGAFMRPALCRSKAFLTALIIPAAVTIALQWSGHLATDYVPSPWGGYKYVWQTPGAYFFFAYYGVYVGLGLAAMTFGARYLENSLHAQQARLLGSTALVPLLLGTITDVILPLCNSTLLPNLAPDFTLVWAIGLVFAMAQYGMLELSPAAAADEIVHNMSDALFLVNADGKIARGNRAASALLAMPEAELASLHIEQLFPPVKTGTQRNARIEPWLDNRRREVSLVRKDGSAVQVLFSAWQLTGPNGERLGSVCVAADITELKRAERELRAARDELEARVRDRTRELSGINEQLKYEAAVRKRSEEQVRLLIQTMQEGLWVVDLEGRTTFTNSKLAELLEFSPEELRGRHPSELADDDSRATVAEALDAAGRGDRVESDWVLCSKTKKRIKVIVQIAPLRESGEHAGAVLTLLDITDRTRMQVQLAQADRMSSLGVLAAGVGHEINNPLTCVITGLHELERRIPKLEPSTLEGEREDLLSCAREANEGAQRVREIVRDLRSFTRSEEQRLAAVDVHRAIDSALNMVSSEIRFRAKLSKEYGEIPRVVGNAGRLSQLFLNLLVNASHAIARGGVDDNEIRIRTWTERSRVFIEVRDTGQGIAPEAIERLFDPFYTTKSVGKGSGLGLWICHQTVVSHGGTIEVENQRGGGAVFRVILPALSSGAVLSAVKIPASQQPSLPRARILIIDDEPLVRRAFARSLEAEHDIVLAASGENARDIMLRDPDFDVILCDLMMPGMSGMDWFKWLSAHDRALAARVVFVTGGAITQKAREFLAQLDNAVLS